METNLRTHRAPRHRRSRRSSIRRMVPSQQSRETSPQASHRHRRRTARTRCGYETGGNCGREREVYQRVDADSTRLSLCGRDPYTTCGHGYMRRELEGLNAMQCQMYLQEEARRISWEIRGVG